MTDIQTASIKASTAARHLAMAAARDLDGVHNNVWLGMGVESLTQAAKGLGYVLVRTRQTQAAADKTEVA